LPVKLLLFAALALPLHGGAQLCSSMPSACLCLFGELARWSFACTAGGQTLARSGQPCTPEKHLQLTALFRMAGRAH
jgi:hypothetical protein